MQRHVLTHTHVFSNEAALSGYLASLGSIDLTPNLEETKTLASNEGWRVVDYSQKKGRSISDFIPPEDKVIAFVGRCLANEPIFAQQDAAVSAAVKAVIGENAGPHQNAPMRVLLVKSSGRYMFGTHSVPALRQEFGAFILG